MIETTVNIAHNLCCNGKFRVNLVHSGMDDEGTLSNFPRQYHHHIYPNRPHFKISPIQNRHRHLFLVEKICLDTNNTTRYVIVHLPKIYVIVIFAFFQLDGRQHGGMAYII